MRREEFKENLAAKQSVLLADVNHSNWLKREGIEKLLLFNSTDYSSYLCSTDSPVITRAKVVKNNNMRHPCFHVNFLACMARSHSYQFDVRVQYLFGSLVKEQLVFLLTSLEDEIFSLVASLGCDLIPSAVSLGASCNISVNCSIAVSTLDDSG